MNRIRFNYFCQEYKGNRGILLLLIKLLGMEQFHPAAKCQKHPPASNIFWICNLSPRLHCLLHPFHRLQSSAACPSSGCRPSSARHQPPIICRLVNRPHRLARRIVLVGHDWASRGNRPLGRFVGGRRNHPEGSRASCSATSRSLSLSLLVRQWELHGGARLRGSTTVARQWGRGDALWLGDMHRFSYIQLRKTMNSIVHVFF